MPRQRIASWDFTNVLHLRGFTYGGQATFLHTELVNEDEEEAVNDALGEAHERDHDEEDHDVRVRQQAHGAGLEAGLLSWAVVARMPHTAPVDGVLEVLPIYRKQRGLRMLQRVHQRQESRSDSYRMVATDEHGHSLAVF